MNNRFIPSILFLFSLLSIFISCNKINEATDLGGDIIPGADGVTTFDTTLSVETYTELFKSTEDSLVIPASDDHILGTITNDPLFGKTNAKIFLQLQPVTYPWSFSEVYKPDSLFLDSVVLVLGFTANYGDSTIQQRVRVYEMSQFNDFRVDTFYLVRNQPFIYNNLLGTKDIIPASMRDSVWAYKDTTNKQLRIRLNDVFGRRLLNYDTTNAYNSDSAFKSYVKGFAIETDENMGNGLMSFDLANSVNTKLAVYYRFMKGGVLDTTVSYFRFTETSAHHNYVNRYDFAGTPMKASGQDPGQDNLVYLINAPGNYATVKIPAIKTFGNRIIHRAELIVEQVSDPSDQKLTTPNALFLDVYDSTLKWHKTVPYDFDLSSDSKGQLFGMYSKVQTDGSGNPINVWKFKLTRYVQNIINGKDSLHDFRLITHRAVIDLTRTSPSTNTGSYLYYTFPINPRMTFGRVRVGGGNHPTQRMRLHIIYSKI